MDIGIVLLLFCAGLAGGVVNALAGGATLITFPALLAAGLPPVVANASNAVAVSPGHLVAALTDRRQLHGLIGRSLAWLVTMALLGGCLGALLLFVTSDKVFGLLVPPLIAFATAIFAMGPRLRTLLPNLSNNKARKFLLAVVSIYGGYFGAGLGVMLLGALTLTGSENARLASTLKNLLASAVSLVTTLVFAFTGLVAWTPTLTVLAGAVIGGFAGARLSAALPASLVRGFVITVGSAMTVIYAWRYWSN